MLRFPYEAQGPALPAFLAGEARVPGVSLGLLRAGLWVELVTH